MTAEPTSSQSRPRLSVTAAVMAWLWPGLGHIVRGDRRRGGLIMFGVLFLVAIGLLVGGVDAVDHRNDRLWFLAQALCGPVAIAADVANQQFVQVKERDWHRDRELRRRYLAERAELSQDPDYDGELTESLRRVGLGHVNEMGTLFVALAGLMNLVVILDALCPRYAPPSSAEAEPTP